MFSGLVARNADQMARRLGPDIASGDLVDSLYAALDSPAKNTLDAATRAIGDSVFFANTSS